MGDLFVLEAMRYAFVAALLVGAAAPSVGVFLVQRRLALMGDGIGHVALTGVALGFLLGTAPVLTAVVVATVGAVVIERVFVIPGVGSMLVDAVAQRDLILVQDVVMVLVALVLVVNFLVDVLYVVIDPRIGGRS